MKVAIVGCGLIGKKRADALAGAQLVACADPDLARATRRAFLEGTANRDVWVLGTHFHAPTAGHVIREGAAWRFRV